MTEAGRGRLLAATLHEAIGERLPERMAFYEHWLHSGGLREGTIGAGPLSAVIGFLRTEGMAYEVVMTRAGELAAAWTVASMRPGWRRFASRLPRALRMRVALRVAAGIARRLSDTSRVSCRVRRGTASVRVSASLFCAVREARSSPLCAYYLAAALESLRQFGLDATGIVEQCHAVGGASCLMRLALADGRIALPAAPATLP